MKIKPIMNDDHLELTRQMDAPENCNDRELEMCPSKDPLDANRLSQRLLGRALPSALARFASSFLRFPQLNKVYDAAAARVDDPAGEENIFSATLETLGSRLEVSDQDLKRIPEEGPLLLVANHPLGGLDGLALMSLILKRRPDVKLLANSVLNRFEAFRPHLLPVDIPSGATGRRCAASTATGISLSRAV